MKTKHVRPILIPQSKATWPNCIWLGKISGQLRLDTSYNDNPKSINPIDDSMLPQELILISLEDEGIEEGDWYCYLSYKGDYKLNQYNEEKHFNEDPCITLANLKAKKVIARQSQIPLEYISKFIEQYNNGCVEDLEIEMIDNGYEVDMEGIGGCDIGWMSKFELKLTNGFVTIVEKEPISYTEGEVLNLLHKLEFDKNINLAAWFEQNKKK